MRKAIALMITLFFIMAITLSLGIGLKYVKEGAQSVNSEQFILQCRSLLDDLITLLKTSPDIAAINSADTLTLFLAQASFIPLNSNDVNVIIEIESARSKITPELFKNQEKSEIMRSFFSTNAVNPEYVDILHDLMNGIKEDGAYNTDIFNDNPYLFRDYIASAKHLEEAQKFYEERFHDEALRKIDQSKLFYLSQETNATNYKVDLNHATPLVWELLLGCDKERAKVLYANEGLYTSQNDLLLSEDENLSLQKFRQNISYYEPYIAIKIRIMHKNQTANISFEYNLESKKGSNFVLEV
ncbi:hypothetical protein [Sulfurimonas sp.]|uniref:hypothetical protein n=1 Tax=Sulfurimonas sp. TaxID=2022749 RepID=UPI0026149455|nr:hypothetical protein [Sulfurimonas sp.]